MIKLKNVSKFYYSKGVIASGFSKINLEFKMGEFVAITGESGSGKSTLLNVISGLDTYEEGEMYINGKETSHYTEKDFEDYRRKYIGNIFQNFNLVNSYTVYQNIELVLLLNGNKKKDIKNKVLELIKKVNLYKFRNTKVSRLSGGQKQRVAIARALAKDTPIIIADEPTGNLDSKAASEVIKILSDISRDKLVIIVTHNYEQVEKYATRKIKMNDGKILEDKVIKNTSEIKIKKVAKHDNITVFNKIRLSLRNTFNIIPKFLLIFAVYLFITVAIISEYSSFKEQKYITSKSGYNNVFLNTNDKRIIIKKKDTSSFNDEDYQKISSLDNIDYIVKNDLLLDTDIGMTDNENFWISGSVNNVSNFKDKLDLGRLPENDSEVIVEGNQNDYYIGSRADDLLEKELYLQDYYSGEVNQNKKIKIVGIKYNENTQNYSNNLYLSDSIINDILFQINQNYSKISILFMDKYFDSPNYGTTNKITPNSNVPEGEVYISSNMNYLCPYEYCIDRSMDVKVDNLYYEDTITLNVSRVYYKWNMNSLLGIEDYENNNGIIYINPNDYNRLFNKGNYQSSVFVKDVKIIDSTAKQLEDMNYKVLLIKDTLVNGGMSEVLEIMSTVVMIILIVVLFFISYFVIKLILKSRNVYFTTIRILGATKKISKQLLVLELLIISNLAYFLFLIFIYLNSIKVVNAKFVNTILTYLTFKDYLVLYIVLILMSYLISQKFSKKLFKNSVISTIKEEV